MSDTGSDTLPSTSGAPKERRPIWVRVLKSTLVSLAIVVGTPIGLLLALWVVLTISPPSYGPTESADLVRISFLGRTLAIPRNHQPCCYADYDGAHPSSLSVEALLPDFAPYTKARRDEWIALGAGRLQVEILVMPLAGMEPLDVRLRRYFADLRDPQGRSVVDDLRVFEIKEGSILPFDLLFIPQDQPNGPAYIQCSLISGKIAAVCHLVFAYDDIAEVRVRFGSRHLSDWREIADGARRLLRSFEVQSR